MVQLGLQQPGVVWTLACGGNIFPNMTDTNDHTQSYITTAALRILKPLVRILMRNGVAYGALAELVRKSYVDVGFEIMEQSGKRPTISGVSGLTGLTRKETRRLREVREPDTAAAAQRYNRAIRVISGWVNDKDFIDSDGEPADLPLDGENSFSELVRRYSGDIPAMAMLMVLRESQCVVDAGDKLQLVARAYIPGGDPVEKLNILGIDTAELLTTIDHNLTASSDSLWYQRKVSSHQLDPGAVDAFRALAADKAQALLEELDAWLTKHEITDPDQSSSYVALGAFYIEQPELDPGKKD